MKTGIIFTAILCSLLLLGCAADVNENIGNTSIISNGSSINITADGPVAQENGNEPSAADEPQISGITTITNNTAENKTEIAEEQNSTDEIINPPDEEDGYDDENSTGPDWGFTGNNDEDLEACFVSARQNEKCEGTSAILCTGKPQLNIADKTLILNLQNKAGDEIELKDLVWFIEDGRRDCMTESFVEKAEVSVANGAFINILSPVKVADNQAFTIKITFSDLNQDYINQGFDLNYVEAGSSNIDYSFSFLSIIAPGE